METVKQNGRFTLFSSKFPSNIYSILDVKNPYILEMNQNKWLFFKLLLVLTNFTLREIRPQYDTRRPHLDYPDHPSPFCVSSQLYPCSSETHEADRILNQKERSIKVQEV